MKGTLHPISNSVHHYRPVILSITIQYHRHLHNTVSTSLSSFHLLTLCMQKYLMQKVIF